MTTQPMMEIGGKRAERAVQVITDRGEEATTRYGRGSGYLVGGPLVVTAAHVLRDGKGYVVRTATGQELTAELRLQSAHHDVAVLHVTGPELGAGPPLACYGQVDRTSDHDVLGCSAVGFPRFKQQERLAGQDLALRETAHIRGEIIPKANMESEDLEFRVSVASTPAQTGVLGGESWLGMSGAVLRARYPRSSDLVVGIITQHHVPEGHRVIRAVPVTALAREPELARILGLADIDALPTLPYRTEQEASHYWATVADVERRTPVLLDRDEWVEWMESFARGAIPGMEQHRYLWLVGHKWSGKTALQAHFVMHAPADIDCVAYFLASRADADSDRFVSVVGDQLAQLLGEPRDALRASTGPIDTYRRLWEWAGKRADNERRPLLLVVDGIDDDVSLESNKPSIVSLLPRLESAWIRVMVASRGRPTIPADVDVSHPIYNAYHQDLGLPSPKVLASTREIERRHRLCPRCKQVDEAAPVPEVADVGYWAGRQQSRSFEASSAVAFPVMTPAFKRFMETVGHHRIAFGCLGLVLFWFALSLALALIVQAESAGVGLIVVGLAVAGFLWWNHAQQEAALRAKARSVWAQLWYCNRDGLIYRPETGEALWPSQLHEFVYREARRMPEPPPSQPAAPAYPSAF